MDEKGVTQQYYIATKSSPADDRARVLKYGRLFSVFDRLGDIQTSGLGEQGLFFQGIRHVSELLLRLWNARPLPLSSTIETNNFLFSAHLTNLDVSHLDAVEPGPKHSVKIMAQWGRFPRCGTLLHTHVFARSVRCRRPRAMCCSATVHQSSHSPARYFKCLLTTLVI